MDTSSNDPLYYLKVIAKTAEEQRDLEKTRFKRWLKCVIPVLLVFLVINYGLVFSMGSKKTETPLTWSDVECSMRGGNLDKALDQANQLLETNSHDYDGLYKKGEILLKLGRKDEAKKSFQAAYDIFPVGKYKEAVDAFKPKLTAKPGVYGQPAQNGQPQIQTQPPVAPPAR